ncbi:MAG TPA: murein biosynthesis integral membrane protein MurJ [Acidimicrobiia bacterium]|nr:murein biosynthesis integral membrane protein MurJ [Acidimicrobiia bacterium]
MRRPLGLGGAALIVSGSVLISRVLGLGRETLLAALLGVSEEGDLYRFAFVVPDFLNYLLAGGFLSITLIPILSRRIEEGNEDALHRDFSAVFRWVGTAIVILTAVLMLVADHVCRVAFPTLGEADLDRVVDLTRIILPAQVAFVLGALLMAYQYSKRRFLYPALAPVIYNLGIIIGGVAGAGQDSNRAAGFIWGALVGAVVGTLVLQWIGARRAGLRISTGNSRAVRSYLTLAFPLMIGQSVTVLDEQFPRLFGQLGADGSAAALSLGRMLNMVPVGVIAQAAAVASYPFLARLVASRAEERTDRVTLRALRGTTFVSMAALAFFFGAATPLVRLVYEWGRFGASDSAQVAMLLAWFSLSIPAWGIHQILGRWFYAHQRMWLPVLVGTAATAGAIPLSLMMFEASGVAGLAIASSIVMWLYTIALTAIWAYRRPDRWRPLAATLGRTLPLALAAAGLIRVLNGAVAAPGTLAALFMTAVSLVVLIAVFAVGGRPLRLEESRPGWWRDTPLAGSAGTPPNAALGGETGTANEPETDPDAPV